MTKSLLVYIPFGIMCIVAIVAEAGVMYKINERLGVFFIVFSICLYAILMKTNQHS